MLNTTFPQQANRALFLADWCDALFIHFCVDPARLRTLVPFDLDIRDGAAYVSLVAFTQRRLRFTRGGRVAALLAAPLAQHEFLNLRTYVRVNDEPAIFFIAEWIPNRLAALIGPRTYGLPYRLARIQYDYNDSKGLLNGAVDSREARFSYHAMMDRRGECRSCRAATLDHFLLERYAAFTYRRGVSRRFRVVHKPWPHVPARLMSIELSLIQQILPWLSEDQMIGANFSPGVCDVAISPPAQVVQGQSTRNAARDSM